MSAYAQDRREFLRAALDATSLSFAPRFAWALGSEEEDYKITNTPYGKDIVKQLADACKERGMPLGFYYSPPDMHHPAFRDTSKLAKENWGGERV